MRRSERKPALENDQGRFSRAVLADQGMDLAGFYPQADILERDGALEPLDDIHGVDRGGASARSR